MSLTVSHIIKCYGATWELEDQGRSRHPSSLSERDDCYLAGLVQTNEHRTTIKSHRVV